MCPGADGGPGITLVSLTRIPTLRPAPVAMRTTISHVRHDRSSQTVADLLGEYQRKGKNIDVLVIDPVNEKDKLAKLHDRL